VNAGGPGAAPAGYSGTPLPRKLGIKEGTRVALVGAPPGFEATLGALPAGAVTRRGARARPISRCGSCARARSLLPECAA